eukprot:366366-Chlamydomonas_euryale.AAC.32
MLCVARRRCLASFEPDAKRKRLMHSQRVARLAPLHGVLNHEHFLGLLRMYRLLAAAATAGGGGFLYCDAFASQVRSIALELGNTSREIMDLLEEERRPKSKVTLDGTHALGAKGNWMEITCNEVFGVAVMCLAQQTVAARLDAVRYYTYFIDTFREPFGPGGKLPDRIEDELQLLHAPAAVTNAQVHDDGWPARNRANERYFLLASFSLGRLMSGGMAADRDMAGMVAAVEHLRGTAAYVDRQHVQHFEREAGMAREMADLISEKLQLAQQLTTAK